MSRKFLTAIDLTQNELQNGVVHNLPGTTGPPTPIKGQMYFDSTGNTLYWWDGTVWVSARGQTPPAPSTTVAGVPIGAGTAGVAVTYSRGDHVHPLSSAAAAAATTFGLAKVDGVAVTVARSDHHHGTPVHDAAAHAAIPISALAGAAAILDMNGHKITEVGDPVAPTDAANKGYVDNAIAGLSWKEAVRVGSTVNVALTGLVAIDGVTPVAGDRVLLKNQTAPAENGIYIAAAGAWSRATDNDSASEMSGAAVFVEEGTTNADTAWVVTTNDPITVGTTAIAWGQFAGGGSITAGAGLTQTGNVFDVGGSTSITVAADTISRAALTGDVTAAANSNATTIAANAVTNTKAADMPTMTFKGNDTGATADPKDLTVAAMQTALGILTATVAQATYNKTMAADCAAALTTTVTHNFNTRDVHVDVYRTTTPWDSVECDLERTTVNTVDVRFATAPTAGQYRIVVQGVDL